MAIVTGAPGWLGSRLVECLLTGLPDVEQLKDAKPRIVRIARQPGVDSHIFDRFGESVQTVECDITNGADVKRLFEGTFKPTVFHIAGIVHPTAGRKQFYDVNVNGTKNLLAGAVNVHAGRFIHVSSNSPLGTNPSRTKLFDEDSPYNPYMHYGQSKREGEDLVNAKSIEGKLETVIIRPPWFYGPGQPARQSLFFSMIKTGKVPIVGSGENLRSMAYIDNICQGLMLAELQESARGQTYWIADRRPYTMNEVVDTIERLLETEFKMQVAHKRMRLPDLASEVALAVDATLQAVGLYHQKFHVLSEMNKDIACSITKAQKELHYDPKVSLEEGMRRSIRWALANGQTI
ncbi:MAG: NAD(P)-dependent oxidoreductase [Candidatus Melainabacteria bacterium]|nr:NAD(P)-dependent oxidoreductase [Candidatus Melainabacteria bacterium]